MVPLFKNRGSKIFWAIGLFFVALFIFLIGFRVYEQWKAERRVAELARELERLEKEVFVRKAADTIGGKTPQETLDMFIQAVEKGDYELASRYFVIERQEQWKKDLSTAKNTEEFLKAVIKAKKTNGEYSFDKKSYSIHTPILVSFVVYPSGNWKIEEI